MSTIILNDEELKGKLLKAFTRILSCIYRQKELKIMRVNNILELVVNKPFKVGMNNFSCTMNACVKIGELEGVKRLNTLSASFTIDNSGEVSINEPLILLDY